MHSIEIEPDSLRPSRSPYDAIPSEYHIYTLYTSPGSLQFELYDTADERVCTIPSYLMCQPSVESCYDVLQKFRTLLSHHEINEFQRWCANIGIPFRPHEDHDRDATRLMVPAERSHDRYIKGSVLKASFTSCKKMYAHSIQNEKNDIFDVKNLPILLAVPGAYKLNETFRHVSHNAGGHASLKPLNDALRHDIGALCGTLDTLIAYIHDDTTYHVKTLDSNTGTEDYSIKCMMGFISPYSFPHQEWLCVCKVGNTYKNIPEIPKCISTGSKQSYNTLSTRGDEKLRILGGVYSTDSVKEVDKDPFWAIVQTTSSITLRPDSALDNHPVLFRCFHQTRTLIRIVAAAWLCAHVIIMNLSDNSLINKPLSFATTQQPILKDLLDECRLIYIWTVVLNNMKGVISTVSACLADSPHDCSFLDDVRSSFKQRYTELFWTVKEGDTNTQLKKEKGKRGICLNPAFFHVQKDKVEQLATTDLLQFGDELFKFYLIEHGSCFKSLTSSDLFKEWKFGETGESHWLMDKEERASCKDMNRVFLGTTIVTPIEQQAAEIFHVIQEEADWETLQRQELESGGDNNVSLVMFNNVHQFGLDAPYETEHPTKRETHAMLMVEEQGSNFRDATVNKKMTLGQMNAKWGLKMYKWHDESSQMLDMEQPQLIHGNDYKLLNLSTTTSPLLQELKQKSNNKSLRCLSGFLLINTANENSQSYQKTLDYGLQKILSNSQGKPTVTDNITVHTNDSLYEDCIVCCLSHVKYVTIGIVDYKLVVIQKHEKKKSIQLKRGGWKLYAVIDYTDNTTQKNKNQDLQGVPVWLMGAWYAARSPTIVTPTQNIAGIMTLQAFAKHNQYKFVKFVGTRSAVKKQREAQETCNVEDSVRLKYTGGGICGKKGRQNKHIKVRARIKGRVRRRGLPRHQRDSVR